jgi:hypothetical protein
MEAGGREWDVESHTITIIIGIIFSLASTSYMARHSIIGAFRRRGSSLGLFLHK